MLYVISPLDPPSLSVALTCMISSLRRTLSRILILYDRWTNIGGLSFKSPTSTVTLVIDDSWKEELSGLSTTSTMKKYEATSSLSRELLVKISPVEGSM